MAIPLPSTAVCQTSFTFPLQFLCKYKCSSPILHTRSHGLVLCSANKKISFVGQILDCIEGGPKLRKWYGASDLLSKGGSVKEDEDEFSEEDEIRDAVLVTDGDSEIARVKALVKDMRTAMGAFGNYVESLIGDASSKLFLKKALRGGVRAVICPNEGFLYNVGSLKGVKHVILLSQLSAYRATTGMQALMKNNARKLAEQDEEKLIASGIPHTIIRVGKLQNAPGGTQGFCFDKGGAEKGTLGKEDAAFICVEALDVVPQKGFEFEVVNGEEKVSDWKDALTKLMEKFEQ